jgi:hypothetical protein
MVLSPDFATDYAHFASVLHHRKNGAENFVLLSFDFNDSEQGDQIGRIFAH